MQDRLELLTRGGGEGRHRTLGPRRLFGQACQAGCMKGMDDMAHGLHAAAHQLRNRLWRQPAGTRQHHLGTTHAAGIGGAPVRFSLPTFIIGQGSDIERWFHNPSIPWEVPLHKSSCGNALVSVPCLFVQ